MSAAESLTESDIRAAFVRTCALAREYDYVPPIEDRCMRRGSDSPSMVVLKPANEETQARALRAENVARFNRLAQVVAPPSVPRRVHYVVEGGGRLRLRRSRAQIDALVNDYKELCKLPFERGQLKALAARHGYRDSTAIIKTLRQRGVYINRRDVRKV